MRSVSNMAGVLVTYRGKLVNGSPEEAIVQSVSESTLLLVVAEEPSRHAWLISHQQIKKLLNQ